MDAELLALRELSAARLDSMPEQYRSLSALAETPKKKARYADADAPVIGAADHPDQINDSIRSFAPWRKGPFLVGGVYLNAEWRSDLKWNRIRSLLPDLSGSRILDLGAGNGYFSLRLYGAGAVPVAVDPTFRFKLMYDWLTSFVDEADLPEFLCLSFEDIRPSTVKWDGIMAMGLIYHLRHPLMLPEWARDHLRSGGWMLLESLIIPGSEDIVLFPAGRYAGAGGMFFIPSASALHSWVRKSGFRVVESVISDLTPVEQRRTEYADVPSLNDFLDPQDPSRTIEGYPAPARMALLLRRS